MECKTMRRRNGNGSQQLQDVTEKLRRGELKLVRVMEEEGLITERERTGLLDQIQRAVSQKRSSEVLATAHTIHNKLIRVLQTSKGGTDKRESSELDVLMELSRLIQTTAEREKVLEQILDLIAQGIPYENGTLFILNRATGQLSVASVRGQHVDLISGVHFDLGYGFSSWVAKQKKPILLGDLHQVARAGRADIGSFLSVPMVVQGELIGVLNLAHSSNQAFNEEHLRLLTLIAAQAAAILQRVLMYEEMARLAITDDLTGLYNRRHFQDRLAHEIRRAQRYGQGFSVIYLDIDHFKMINDNWGHALGDRILADMGKVLLRWGRSSDLIARFGGEEFVALLPMTDADRAVRAAERLRCMVEEHSFPRRKRLTISLGISTYPADGEAGDELLRKADAALYLAKRLGRNRAVVTGAEAAPSETVLGEVA
jgi:diguanylate cyclase (GGDEF)-like protein